MTPTEFIQKFPTIRSLAEANTADVLKIWKGLGYNRRALFLKKACEKLNQNSINETSFPKDKRELVSLPGIGQSTAGAIMAFESVTVVTNSLRLKNTKL